MRAVLLPLLFILSACAANIQVGDPAPDPTPTIIGEGTNPGSAIVVYRASETGFLANVATNPGALFRGTVDGDVSHRRASGDPAGSGQLCGGGDHAGRASTRGGFSSRGSDALRALRDNRDAVACSAAVP